MKFFIIPMTCIHLIALTPFFTANAKSKESSQVTKKTVHRKTQEVDFAEANLKGTIRNPDGLYLVQKKGIKFLSLFSIHKNLDEKIRNSSHFLD